MAACIDSRRDTRDIPNTSFETTTNVIVLLRHLTFKKSKILRSLLYAALYSFISTCCVSPASTVSSSYLWLACVEVGTALLLEGLHLRWTQTIISRAPPSKKPFAHTWRTLFLPALAHALAPKVVTDVPTVISARLSDPTSTAPDTVAGKQIAALIMAFALRFLVLYPTWARLICFEISLTQAVHDSGKSTVFENLYRYWDTLQLCYRTVLLRLAGLRLQAAGILIWIEALLCLVFFTAST